MRTPLASGLPGSERLESFSSVLLLLYWFRLRQHLFSVKDIGPKTWTKGKIEGVI